MGKVIFKRHKRSRDLETISSFPFEGDHSEEDLHKFLELEPSLIARGVGTGDPLPTMVIGSHLKLDDGELDLLLVDSEGELTIAELKRGRTPREVVAQVLDYASQLEEIGFYRLADYGVDWDTAIENLNQEMTETDSLDYDRLRVSFQRPRLLVVAFEIDPVTLRITEYLRSRGLPIYCVEFEYFSDQDYEYFYPELIGVNEVQKIVQQDETDTQREYRSIWKDLLGRFKEQMPGVTSRSAPNGPYSSIPIGITHAHLEWWIHSLNKDDGWFEVGLHFENQQKEKNLAAVNWIQNKRDAVREILGEEPVYEDDWGTRWARVYLRKEAPEVNQEVKDWALEKMLVFYDLVEELEVVAELRRLGW